MEENNTTSMPTSGKPSYEQLEQGFIQLQQRLMQTEARLRAINLTAMRLDYLFKVLDRATYFPEKFIADSSAEIVDLLEVKKPDTESQTTDFPEE